MFPRMGHSSFGLFQLLIETNIVLLKTVIFKTILIKAAVFKSITFIHSQVLVISSCLTVKKKKKITSRWQDTGLYADQTLAEKH